MKPPPALFLDRSRNRNFFGVRYCSLCHGWRLVCRLLDQLKSLADRPIQQAISSQA
jgi:hypothetical protein